MEKILKDELIGLNVRINECTDPSWTGKQGTIIDETKNIFVLNMTGNEKMISKETAKFEFDYEGKKVMIDGKKLKYRPEDRIKKAR